MISRSRSDEDKKILDTLHSGLQLFSTGLVNYRQPLIVGSVASRFESLTTTN